MLVVNYQRAQSVIFFFPLVVEPHSYTLCQVYSTKFCKAKVFHIFIGSAAVPPQ